MSDRTVAYCEYVYNLDESADYIYVEFEEGGYALFASETMEMMEYSFQGELPYSTSTEKNYYAGPANYLEKINSNFFDMRTNEPLDITEEEATVFAEQIRTNIKSKTAYRSDFFAQSSNIEETINAFLNPNAIMSTQNARNGAPNIDTENLITGNLMVGTMIPNYRYFLARPTHGRNIKGETYANGKTGTCGPVAAQILLGYHNYYSDRRIVPNKYLNGYDDATKKVVNGALNPNYCPDPMDMTSEIIGTRSEGTGTNSFYVHMISRIMKSHKDGSFIQEVYDGINEYLSEHLNDSTTGYLINYESNDLFNAPIDSSDVEGEINDGRPIIIAMDSRLGGSDHFVVGYGYQNYTYTNGSGTYEGYIVHFGWGGKTCVWVNSSWCDGYVSLKINHTHEYQKVIKNERAEYECYTCHHRTDYAINMEQTPRYAEREAWVDGTEAFCREPYSPCKDYYVTFNAAGSMLFQTFGNGDARLYLYDKEYNLLAYNNNDGWNENALFYYTVQPSTPYVLRVELFFDDTYEENERKGFVKVALTPASYECEDYEEIDNTTGTSDSYLVDTYLDTAYIATFTPTQTGTYSIKLNYVDVYLDTVLYVANPTKTGLEYTWYNDDGALQKQAMLTETLVAGVPYFIVISTYDIELDEGTIDVYIRKIS